MIVVNMGMVGIRGVMTMENVTVGGDAVEIQDD